MIKCSKHPFRGLTFFCFALILGFSRALYAEKIDKAPLNVRVVYYIYPPHIFEEDGQLRGAATEVWAKVAQKAGLEIEWIGPVPFRRAQYMLETGEVDAIMRLAKTPEREKLFVYSKEAPMWGHQGIAVLKDEPKNEIRKAEDLYDKTIGMIDGGIVPDFMVGHLKKILLEPVPADSVEINMKKLFRKRIWGVYFVFTDVARYYAAKENRLDEIKFLKYPGSEGFKYGYMAVSKKADPRLAKKIIKAVDAVVPTYDYEKLTQKYIDEALLKSKKTASKPDQKPSSP